LVGYSGLGNNKNILDDKNGSNQSYNITNTTITQDTLGLYIRMDQVLITANFTSYPGRLININWNGSNIVQNIGSLPTDRTVVRLDRVKRLYEWFNNISYTYLSDDCFERVD
jgi:hypothetical protein